GSVLPARSQAVRRNGCRRARPLAGPAVTRSRAPNARSANPIEREPDRTDVVAAPARVKAADLPGHEVTGYRASTVNALKAQTEEISHAACCHRPGKQGIADLHSSTGRDDSRRAMPDRGCR